MEALTMHEKDIAAESFQDLKYFIWKIVNDFHTKYGGDLQELFSVACESFIKAVKTYNKDKSKLITYAGFVIQKSLIDYIRKQHKHPIIGLLKFELTLTTKKHNDYKLINLFYDLSDDAKCIAELILEPSLEFRQAALKNKNKKILKKEIQEHLHKQHKWKFERIWQAFRELTEAINA